MDAIEGQQRDEGSSDEDPFNDLEDQTVCKQILTSLLTQQQSVFIHVLMSIAMIILCNN